MKKEIILVSLCIFITCAEGLKCYTCLFHDGPLPAELSFNATSEPKCREGQKLDNSFLVDCAELMYSRTAINDTGTPNTLRNKLQSAIAPNQEGGNFSYTCLTLSYDGNFYPVYGGNERKSIFRTCIPKPLPETYLEECHKGKMNNLNITDPYVRFAVHSQGLGPFMNINSTNVNVCTCNKDKCNGNGGLVGATASIFLLVTSIVVGLTKQFCNS